MKVESIAFCNTFDLHEAIIGIENQFSVFLKVAVYTAFTVIQTTRVRVKDKKIRSPYTNIYF